METPTSDRKNTAQALYTECTSLSYDINSHAEEWQNEVAKDLNALLGRVQWTLETDPDCPDVDIEFAQASLRLVKRVAEFEGIMEGGDKPKLRNRRKRSDS